MKVVSFETPEVLVQLTNVALDLNKKTFILTLGTKTSKQRKFHTEEVSGTITSEVYNYFTRLRPVKVPVVNQDTGEIEWLPTGENATNFQKYLSKRNMVGTKLSEIVFETGNTSPDYAANPFRLAMLGERNILTLVTVPSKSKTEVLQQDGSTKIYYKSKYGQIDGKLVKAFVRPEKYRRLVIKTYKEVEVATPEMLQG